MILLIQIDYNCIGFSQADFGLLPCATFAGSICPVILLVFYHGAWGSVHIYVVYVEAKDPGAYIGPT